MEQFNTDTDTTHLLREIVEETLPVLKTGGIILYPTDSTWGIGCDSMIKESVERIQKIKKYPEDEYKVLLVDSLDHLKRYVDYVHPRLETLLYYHQRPLTVVYNQVTKLPNHLLHSDGSAAIRITSDPFCRELIHMLDRPLVGASANIKGQPYPGHFGEISSEIIRAVDHVVKWRQHDKGDQQPSVIVTVNKKGELKFIRN